jgi:hypothetical protein
MFAFFPPILSYPSQISTQRRTAHHTHARFFTKEKGAAFSLFLFSP